MKVDKVIDRKINASSLTCLICGSTDFKVLFDKLVNDKKFSVLECKKCGLVLTHPQIRPDEFSIYYLDDYDAYKPFYGRLLSFLVNNTVYRGQWLKIKRMIGKKADVLEIGCGNGEFTRFLIGYTGWNIVGIEPGEKVAEAARKAGLDVQTCGIEDYKTDKKFDLIIVRHVLEHLNNPLESLTNIRKLLKNNGKVYVTLPNVETFEKKFFGTDWFAWEVPRHMFHFNPKTLSLIAKKSGLKIKRIKYSITPNNIIKSYHDKLARKGHKRIAKLFKISNVFLIVLFLPLSVLLGLTGRSGRMNILLNVEKS